MEENCVSPLRMTKQCKRCPKLQKCNLSEAIQTRIGSEATSNVPACSRIVKSGAEGENKDG